jgi:hypothetical protein
MFAIFLILNFLFSKGETTGFNRMHVMPLEANSTDEDSNESRESHLILSLHGVCALVSLGVLPLFVLDGKSSPAKCMSEKISINRLGQLQSDIITFCEMAGISWLKAEGEAEETLTALENHGQVNIQCHAELISDRRYHLR